MAEAVLDSSAILGLLLLEPGFERVGKIVARSLVSVVNEAEVISVLIQRGHTAEAALASIAALPYTAVELDRRLAQRAGTLWQEFKKRGLSLGDRCCLALAEREGLPAVTSDKRWADVPINVKIVFFK